MDVDRLRDVGRRVLRRHGHDDVVAVLGHHTSPVSPEWFCGCSVNFIGSIDPFGSEGRAPRSARTRAAVAAAMRTRHKSYLQNEWPPAFGSLPLCHPERSEAKSKDR